MNTWLAGAAGFAALTTVIHVIGGGQTVYSPLLATQSSAELGAYVSVLWHGVTAALFLIAVTLGIAAIKPQNRQALGWVAIFLSAAFFAVFVGYGLSELGNLTVMPQWSVFLLICALAIIGVTRRDQTTP